MLAGLAMARGCMWCLTPDAIPAGMPLNLGSGAKGNRTLDLVIANDALYQLSYSPESTLECSGRPAAPLSAKAV